MTTDSTPTHHAKHGNGPLAALLGVLLALFCAVADAPQPAQATMSGGAAKQTVYGPKVFRKDEGRPVILTDTFVVEQPVAGCLLIVDYGSGPREHKHDTPRHHGRDDDDDDQDRRQSCDPVSRAAIDLNGERVLQVRDFARDRKRLVRPVEVHPENDLEVWLLSKPEGCLRIRIVCEADGNELPQADAGPDQTAHVGDTVTLDGSGSTDLDGDPLTYAWSFVPPLPDGSSAVLIDADTVSPYFTVDAYGDYRIQLVVNDGTADSAPDTVTVSTLNSAPVADAGPDQTAHVGDTVVLDGSGSSDVDGQALTYLWELTPPSGSGATLDDPTAVMPQVTIDLPGSYLGTLRVNDGIVDSAPDTVTITTENSVPVADAGPDQTAYVGDTVTLDGSASSDLDGDPLSYLWSLSVPLGSGAALDDPTAISPHFGIDLPGTYVGQLIVNDGQASSDPDTVAISTLNSRPVACITAPATAFVGEAVSLDGTCSSDADGDLLGFTWSLPTAPDGSSPDLSGIDSDTATLIPDLPGLYVTQLIVDDGVLASDPVTASITAELPPPVNQSPEITSTPVIAATVGQPYSYDVEATDPDGDPLTFGLTAGPAGMSIDAPSGLVQWTPTDADLAASPVAVTVQVVDGQGGSDAQSFSISVGSGAVQPTVPAVVGLTKTEAMDLILAARLSLGTFTYVYDAVAPDGQVLDQAPAAGTLVDLGAAVDLTVSLGPDEGLPPNPETVAPPLDPTVVTPFGARTEFLYTGDNPIQTGVAPGTIEPRRAAVIHGRVLDRANNPLPGVTVTVLDHPELGQTLSRTDGAFDLAVNGGGYLVVDYRKSGYLPLQRRMDVPWQDYALVDDVVLIPLDTNVTAIDLNATVPFQVAQGSVVTDADGTRQATLLFPQSLQAQIYDADGNLQPIETLHFRATEYTVGDNGPQAMPAELPPTSAYTYAAELSVDEAVRKVDGKDVLFSLPVPMYLDNFLDVGVGANVPVGFYDRDKAAWVPDYDGRVVKILSIANGAAELDTNGDGLADNGIDLGVTEAERRELAGLYAEGKTLWRVALSHLSTVDLNFGGQPIPDPNQKPPEHPTSPWGCILSGNSSIECQNQILHEDIAVTGTPFDLHYASDRTPGRIAANRLKIHLSGPSLPSTAPLVWRILLTIEVAGRRFEYQYPAEPNLTHEFVWDGKDALGRTLQGTQPVTVVVGWAYTNIYGQPYIAVVSGGARSFAMAPTGPLPGDVITRTPSFATQTFKTTVGAWDAQTAGLGGWDLDVHHAYDPVGKVFYGGDGTRRSAANANDAALLDANIRARHCAVDATGSRYVTASTPNGMVVQRIDDAGNITNVTGGGTLGCDATNVPATDVWMRFVMDAGGFDLGPDGSLYIGDRECGIVRRVDTNGIMTTVAGRGPGCGGDLSSNVNLQWDGGPATEACIVELRDIAVAPDGTLYLVSFYRWERNPYLNTAQYWYYIRRVDPGGIITPTYIWAGWSNYTLALSPDGDLFLGQSARVLRIGSDGQTTTVAGTGTTGFGGDGGPATEALLGGINDLDVDPEGNLLIADTVNGRVRRVDTEGIIDTIAGGGSIFSGAVVPARQVNLGYNTPGTYGPYCVAANSEWVIANSIGNYNNIWRVGSPLPGFDNGEIAVASEDGSELYRFSPEGRHLESLNALTGAALYTFGYDAAGHLSSVTDGDGNVTLVERLGDGTPTAIVAPFGQRTTLVNGADGYLSSAADPAGNTYVYTYRDGGLLETLTDPNGHTTDFAYDGDGLLTLDRSAVGGGLTLDRAGGYSDDYTVSVKEAEAEPTSYRVERTSKSDHRWTNSFPDGTVATAHFKTDATTDVQLPDGTQTHRVDGADPRFGLSAPVPTSFTVTTPGGRVGTIARGRAATLNDPNDLLSLATLTETATLNGRTTTSAFDAATRTYTNTSPAGRQTQTVIDTQGRLIESRTPGLLPINATYDAKGRLDTLTQGTDPDARTVTLAYDADGYLASITDALGRSAGFAYDPAGRVTAQTFPDGRQVLFGYDPKGNLTGLTPPGRPEHAFGYTPVDLTAEYVPPDVGAGTNSTQYSYNLDKQLTRVLRPDGETVDLAYDTAGRLATLTVPEGAFSYGYEATTGNLSRITAPDGGTLDFSYDGSLLTGAAWAGEIAGSVGFAYDNDFRVSSVIVDGTDPVAYAYDPDSLLTKAGALTLSRDVQNGLLIGSSLGTVTDTWAYNGFGEPAGYTTAQGGTPLLAIAYARDKLGRITEKTETLGGATTTYAYGYDLAGRLEQVSKDGAVQTTWGYDANGNRTHVNGAEIAHYDDQDRLLDYAGATYAYTANGELQTKTEGASVTHYDYDVLGNLRQVVFEPPLPSGEGGGEGIAAIDYLTDGRNRRIGKKVNGTLVQGFLYQDQLKPVAELDGAGNIVSRFVYATRVNVPDYMVKGGVTYRIVTDHLGSPRLVVNTADGSVVQRMDYDAWGNVLADTNPGSQPFGFAGGLYDRDTGLVRFGARDYEAGVGRWLSKDSLRYRGGDSNFYAYAISDSVNVFDSNGKCYRRFRDEFDLISAYRRAKPDHSPSWPNDLYRRGYPGGIGRPPGGAWLDPGGASTGYGPEPYLPRTPSFPSPGDPQTLPDVGYDVFLDYKTELSWAIEWAIETFPEDLCGCEEDSPVPGMSLQDQIEFWNEMADY